MKHGCYLRLRRARQLFTISCLLTMITIWHVLNAKGMIVILWRRSGKRVRTVGAIKKSGPRRAIRRPLLERTPTCRDQSLFHQGNRWPRDASARVLGQLRNLNFGKAKLFRFFRSLRKRGDFLGNEVTANTQEDTRCRLSKKTWGVIHLSLPDI